MAYEVDLTKQSIDVVSEVFRTGSTFADVSKIISVSATLARAFQFVAAALMLIGKLLTDTKHGQVLRGLQNLGRKIDQVRSDIQELKYDNTWEIVMHQNADNETDIELGMHYLFEIANSTGINEMTMHQKDLNETCARKRCTLALNALFAGVNGRSHFRKSILYEFYDKTGGNRQKVSALATRLLQLIYGGMTVVSTYERMVHGQARAVKLEKTLDHQWRSACASVKSVLDECTQNFRVNMLKDLNAFLDTGESNEDLVTEISNFMRDKYDWLENYCLVYDDVYGSDKHSFNGHRVDSLHRNGKCGIVFYRMKGQPSRFSDRYYEVYRIVKAPQCPSSFFYSPDAQKCQESIVATLDSRGIGWTGCVVITMSSDDLRIAGTFTASTVSANIMRGGWVYYWISKVAARGIVLLE